MYKYNNSTAVLLTENIYGRINPVYASYALPEKTPCARDKTNRGKEELPLVEHCTRNVQAGIKAPGNRKGFSLFMPVFPLPGRQKNRYAMQDKEKWSIPKKQEVGQGRHKALGRLRIPARTDVDKDKKEPYASKEKG